MNRTNLLDLPVLPMDRDDAGGTDIIQQAFVAERKAIRNPEAMKPFIERWKPLWLLSSGPAFPNAKKETLISQCREPLVIPVQKLLCINLIEAAEIFNISDNDFSGTEINDILFVAAEFRLPFPLYAAYALARQYGVGSDLGMVRLFLDSYPELVNEGRPFKVKTNE